MRRLALISLVALAACEPASPLVDRSGVRVVTSAGAFGCTPLTTITTTTGVSGAIVREQALELARNATLEKVRESGGDTAVFLSGDEGSDDLFVRARAYRCGA